MPEIMSSKADSGPERTRGGSFLVPRVDIFESEAELTLLAEMPGVRPEDVDLNYDRGELVLRARVQPRPRLGEPVTQEFAVNDFYRVFQISESIDSSRIQAGCKNGLLTVHLPKLEAMQPRHVAVRGE